RVPVNPLIRVDVARPPVVMDIATRHLDVVSTVLIQTRVVVAMTNLDMVEGHVVGVHEVDQVHIWSSRPRKDQAMRRHRRALECDVCALNSGAPLDHGYLTEIVCKRDAAARSSGMAHCLVVAAG